MDAIAWLRISFVGFSLGGLLLIIAIFMFIKMNIPAIIGDLTGRTAAKKIQEIRQQNSGHKRQTPNAFNLEQEAKRTGRLGGRGKTGRMGRTGATAGFNETLHPATGQDETVLLSDETQLLSRDAQYLSHETELLDETTVFEETTILDETTVLDETTILDETTVLDETMLLEEETDQAVAFKIVKDLKAIHTKEVI